MFEIDAQDPTKLTMIGKPAAVPGEFVNTVAASSKHSLVCAAATGAKAGISCSTFDAQNGIGAMDGLREFDLNQTTPPVGPTNTVSQLFFSGDENTLFATVKGNPTKNNMGFLSAFSVTPAEQSCNGNEATLQTMDTRSSPNGTAVLFGSFPIKGGSNIFATDASFGAAIISINDKGEGSTVTAQPIAGQKATCCVTISDASHSAFVTDVANPRIVEMSLTDAKILGQLDTSATGATGMIDLRAAGDFVYALAPGDANSTTQVLVTNVKQGIKNAKVIQVFDASSMGAGQRSQGMSALE